MKRRISRRIKTGLLVGLAGIMFLLSAGCGETQESLIPLPKPERDGGMFGVDVNINMSTIDNYLERPDVIYRDMRMLYDPADFEELGGISKLTRTLPGFRVTPLPYIATLNAMPVEGMYDGDKLYDVVWSEDSEILEVTANYLESEQILNELFPKDQTIFLMCGGAGYSFLTRNFLVHMGWDENLIFSTGGNWYYEGNKSIDLLVGDKIATWRVDYAYIDFDNLTRVR
ncbi:MAG: hypothetical protein FWH24_05255 [Oscillospiraceae bacterium]|nr:hypothetical protein [Oscillospiraceae bacterium]